MRLPAAALALALPLASMAPASAAPLFTVHMAPGAPAHNDGLTARTPVGSLARVQEVLRRHRPKSDVEVRIEQGVYRSAGMQDWRFYIPGHTISFMPADYEQGTGLPPGGRPVFRNVAGHPGGFWFQARLPKDRTDPLHNGGDSGLRFYYLQVEEYSAGAISIFGDSERDVSDESHDPPLRVRGSQGLNGNLLFGMMLRNLGDKHAPGAPFGYGAVVLTNSSGNRIENNTFDRVENTDPHAGYVHGTYVTHFSSSNVIVRNRFEWISGDPIKVRNASSYNVFEHNTFDRTGRTAHYADEFCDLDCARKNKIDRQCASFHNRLFRNKLGRSHTGDAALPAWLLTPAGLTNAGGAPCSIPAGDVRLRTGSNTS
ncbi:right-handed parallel beta-helix repeat-containing protein [Allokutzneria albata]|uniref:Right handed beta helix region n=1 Tax=Allokutzneria albata TaxID=211114 RepID=A0A1H0A5K0_ALLAB|nr:right-handed parallel beta-helix repeat-containing protein [Allokutzneria albata]SDN28735.1 Right handed beta helix region [Allokutzneria albata]